MTRRRSWAALALAFCLVVALPARAQEQCLAMDDDLREGQMHELRLTRAGLKILTSATTASVPILRVVRLPDPKTAAGPSPSREAFEARFSSGGRRLRTNLAAGRYLAQLYWATFAWPKQSTVLAPVVECSDTIVAVLPPLPLGTRGSWNPTPQVWGAVGYAFGQTGLELSDIVGRYGIAVAATALPWDDAGWLRASATIRRTATRGYWEFGVRATLRAEGHDWWTPRSPHPLIGFGLELPPLRRRPTWIVGALAFPSAPFGTVQDWRLWRPGRWTYESGHYDVYLGLRWDLRRVRR